MIKVGHNIVNVLLTLLHELFIRYYDNLQSCHVSIYIVDCQALMIHYFCPWFETNGDKWSFCFALHNSLHCKIILTMNCIL